MLLYSSKAKLQQYFKPTKKIDVFFKKILAHFDGKCDNFTVFDWYLRC